MLGFVSESNLRRCFAPGEPALLERRGGYCCVEHCPLPWNHSRVTESGFLVAYCSDHYAVACVTFSRDRRFTRMPGAFRHPQQQRALDR